MSTTQKMVKRVRISLRCIKRANKMNDERKSNSAIRERRKKIRGKCAIEETNGAVIQLRRARVG